MQFELTREFIQHLEVLIENENYEELLTTFENLHPADIADIIEELDHDQAKYVFFNLNPTLASKTLVELEEDRIDKILRVIPAEIIATELIEKMDTDDAADVLQAIPDRIKNDILNSITNNELKNDIVNLLDYDENSAGGLMATELIRVNINWDVRTCISEIRRQPQEVENILFVYVVDDSNRLMGTLAVTKLISNHEKVNIQDIYEKDVIYVHTSASSEEVAHIMEKYDLFVLPVIDSINRLKGRITLDDVIDVIREEADKDYQMISGITQDVESSDTIFKQSRARLPWLFIGMFGGIIGAQILGNFQEEIQTYAGLALFLPLIAAMGGNVGVQSSSIIVQSLANGSIGVESTVYKLFKEFLGGALNGIICSSALFIYNLLFLDSLALTYSVSSALILVIIFASVMGTLIPLVLNKLKFDPALATGPFITTINDIIGLLTYLFIAQLFF